MIGRSEKPEERDARIKREREERQKLFDELHARVRAGTIDVNTLWRHFEDVARAFEDHVLHEESLAAFKADVLDTAAKIAQLEVPPTMIANKSFGRMPDDDSKVDIHVPIEDYEKIRGQLRIAYGSHEAIKHELQTLHTNVMRFESLYRDVAIAAQALHKYAQRSKSEGIDPEWDRLSENLGRALVAWGMRRVGETISEAQAVELVFRMLHHFESRRHGEGRVPPFEDVRRVVERVLRERG